MKKNAWLVMGMAGMLFFCGCGSSISAKSEARDMAVSEAIYENGTTYNYYDKSGSSLAFGSNVETTEDRYVSDTVDDTGETNLYNVESEKLIRTVTMRVQTKEFDTLLSYLDDKVAEFGGYIQNSQIYGNSMESSGYRSASLTLRIPQSSLDTFVSGVSETATVVQKTENAENVTLQYADTEARLKSLQIEQERFLALLEKADTVESILVLEEHLTELRYEIESYASTLKIYDNRVEYSTVTLDITEVNRIVPVEQNPTMLTRMKDGFVNTWYEFKDSLANFVVWLVTNVLYLLLWAAVIVVVVVVVKKQVTKRKIRKTAAQGTMVHRTDEEQNDGMDFKK